MTFATPLGLLLLVPLAAWAAWRLRHRAQSPWLAAADGPAIAAAARGSRSWRLRLRATPGVLHWLALALLVCALARPRHGLAVSTTPEDGIDIALALDISGSMLLSADNERGGPAIGGPSRIQAAKDVLHEFVGTLESDRVGLVVFQSRALLLSPLTQDHRALLQQIDTAAPGMLPDGTAIGSGLGQAVDLLRDSPARSRVVILLTDGANNAGQITPVQAAQIARALDVHVYTIGFASRTGNDVDRALLQQIAERTGGASYTASTRSELAQAYAKIAALERSRIGERDFTTYREYAPWLAIGALALLVIEAYARALVWRRYP